MIDTNRTLVIIHNIKNNGRCWISQDDDLRDKLGLSLDKVYYCFECYYNRSNQYKTITNAHDRLYFFKKELNKIKLDLIKETYLSNNGKESM